MDQTQDHISDRKTWLVWLFFVALSCFVEITSAHMEVARSGANADVSLEWLYEISSHFAILVATLLIPFLLKHYPVTVENWSRRWPVFLVGYFAFLIVHVLLMVAIRQLIFPFFSSGAYEFGLHKAEPWIYEARKDAMTYLSALALFLIGRQIGQLKLEAQGAREEARNTGRLTLKCGGKIIFLNANEIIYAKAAANYVEIHTVAGQHLARMTLSALEKLLSETGRQHSRIHRSYLVHKDAIRTLTPNGDGDAIAQLKDGSCLPVSRKYRGTLC